MKKISLNIILLAFLLTACSDWLDVNPRTERKEEELFKTEDGFKSALTGVYIQLGSSSLYGLNAGMYIPDFLAHLWENQGKYNNEKNYALYNWNFTEDGVKNAIDGLWSAYYSSIVHLNNILENLEGKAAVFQYGNYELLKGEALGLRGFLHLELLRLFGPVPDASAQGKAAIPYVTEVTKSPEKLLSLPYSEVIGKIRKDLDEAEELLKNDPLTIGTNELLNTPWMSWGDLEKPIDEWQFYRQVRFNLFAVKAAKARFYHWIGDIQNAVKYAGEVVDSEKFRLATEYDYIGYNDDYESSLEMLSEHIFGVHNPKLQKVLQSYFKNEDPILRQTPDAVEKAYEGIEGDIRYKRDRYWKTTIAGYAEINMFRKYTGNDDLEPQNTVPVLRLSEMYLILSEDLPAGSREAYFREYLLARGLPLEWENRLSENLQECLEKEYRKEFWGEGQLFFFYKKHAYREFTWPKKFSIPENGYQIPKPESQSVFE